MFALIAATTAIEMNSNYFDGWLYLGISHLETANRASLTSSNIDHHKNKAKEAFGRAIQLNPDNELVKQYLDQLISR